MSGLRVSGGRFVPLIASGCALGRFFGQVVASPFNRILLNRERTTGLYALLGGAAVVGGVERMVLSLTVILMEATSNVRFGLPLLVTLIFARWSGHFFFSVSLNDALIDVTPSLPFVPWNAPRWYDKLGVKDVMARKPSVVHAVERAGMVLNTLLSSRHNCFPVVVIDGDQRKLVGSILRRHLLVLLSNKWKGRALQREENYARTFMKCHTGRVQRRLSQRLDVAQHESRHVVPHDAFEELYPRYVRIEEITLSEEEKNMFLDLTPYMSIPHTVPAYASLPRAFEVFKRLELRHLCVTNISGDVVGIVSRKDLSLEKCKNVAMSKEGGSISRQGTLAI